MKHTIIIIAALLLAGCGPDERQGAPALSMVTPQNYHIDTLFTKDGCTLYRFYDASYYRYFAKCSSTVQTSSELTETCGKGCTRRVIQTIDTEAK